MTPADLGALLTALGYGAYVPLALAVVGLAAKIDAIAPQATEASPAWWRVVRRALDVLGGNWGNATNAPAVPPGEGLNEFLVALNARPPQPPITKVLNQ